MAEAHRPKLPKPAVDWSSLPRDALETISNLLTSFDPDYISFRSVCSSWRSAAPRRPQLPWLIGCRIDGTNGDQQHILSFHSLSPSGTNQILPVPNLPESAPFGGLPCRGSSHGWLALLDPVAPSIVLWNPLTRSNIQLPTLPPFVDDSGCCCKFSGAHAREECLLSRVILSSDPAVSSDYLALAICCCRKELVFCRGGDVEWTMLRCPYFRGPTTEAAFYRGQFYVASHADVYVCIYGDYPRAEKIASVNKGEYGVKFRIDESRLVESDGDLLLVLGSYTDPFSVIRKKGYKFKVFKLDWGEQLRLVKLNGIGDRALFLGRNHSISVTAAQYPNCRANSIYYTEICCSPESHKVTSVRVYTFHNSRTEFIENDSDNLHSGWRPCLWFMPSLLATSSWTSDASTGTSKW